MKVKAQKNTEKNEVVTIVVTEENMDFIISHNSPNAETKKENTALATKTGSSPKTVTLSFDFNDDGGCYEIVFTGNRDKILIGDFYSLLNENRRINRGANG